MEAKDDLLKSYQERLGLSPNAGTGPPLTVSENTITPTHLIHHVGSGLIKNVTVPAGFNSGTIYLVPDAVFTTDTSGNIRNSFAASVGQVVVASYDGKKWSLLQSPFADTGTTLSTTRDISTTGTISTNGSGPSKLTFYEQTSGHELSWTVGQDKPTGKCVTGSVYTRSDGGNRSTLYVCEASAWVAK